MTRRRADLADDRGAVLVYVAVVMVGLLAMATYVVDFGMFWVARQQAQNAADAGAYAAVVALAQDSARDRSDSGIAKLTALAIGQQNLVWGEAPSLTAADVTFPTCPVDGTDACVRVAVYRTVARGNPLPAVFGRLIGLSTQDVQAVTTAEVRPGNTAQCVKPWAIPDRWTDQSAPPNATFDKYQPSPPNPPGQLLPAPDLYTPPSATATGTGYRLDRDLGAATTLHQGCTAVASCQPAQLGYFLPLDLAPGCTGGSYQNAITNCATTCDGSPVNVTLNQDLVYKPSGPAGLTTQTQAGVAALIALDPTAVFNPLTNKVENSCVGGGGIPYTCAQPGLVESPRIVAVPAYDVNWFEDHRRPGGGATVNNLIHVSNILSVFVDSSASGNVATHIVAKSATWDPTKSVVTDGSAFTHTLLIVR